MNCGSSVYWLLELFSSSHSGDVIDNQKIETFEQLSNINPLVYLHYELGMQSDQIYAMLKRKTSVTPNYKGRKAEIKYGTKSFAFIYPEKLFEIQNIIFKTHKMDYDILQESLVIVLVNSSKILSCRIFSIWNLIFQVK